MEDKLIFAQEFNLGFYNGNIRILGFGYSKGI